MSSLNSALVNHQVGKELISFFQQSRLILPLATGELERNFEKHGQLQKRWWQIVKVLNFRNYEIPKHSRTISQLL